MALLGLICGNNKTKSDSNFAPTFVDHHLLPDINFNGHCLIKNSIFIPKKSHQFIYFLHTKSMITQILQYNFLFRSVKLTKNADSDKYKYSGYGIGFDSRSEFYVTDVIIFGADMNSSV